MQRKRDEMVSTGAVFSVLVGKVKEAIQPSPQGVHHFTRLDQVDQLVGASEADPDMGFMARLLALCSLPRTNPGDRKEYVRRNGPYALVMSAGGLNKLPYGNLPRLLLAWVCTEAVRTQSRELALGRSLSEFMRKVGMEDRSGSERGDRTRLRNQMKRLFGCTVSMIYEDSSGYKRVSSLVADAHEFWWDPKRPDDRMLWESKIELGEKFFNEIIQHPVPARYEHPEGPQALLPGPRPVPLAQLPNLCNQESVAVHLAATLPPVRRKSDQSARKASNPRLPP